jgi:hypothetical protein
MFKSQMRVLVQRLGMKRNAKSMKFFASFQCVKWRRGLRADPEKASPASQMYDYFVPKNPCTSGEIMP